MDCPHYRGYYAAMGTVFAVRLQDGDQIHGNSVGTGTLAAAQQQQQRPFNGLWSGTTRVGRYQKKHSPTHTHPDHRASFITFIHLQRSMASSCCGSTVVLVVSFTIFKASSSYWHNRKLRTGWIWCYVKDNKCQVNSLSLLKNTSWCFVGCVKEILYRGDGDGNEETAGTWWG